MTGAKRPRVTRVEGDGPQEVKKRCCTHQWATTKATPRRAPETKRDSQLKQNKPVEQAWLVAKLVRWLRLFAPLPPPPRGPHCLPRVYRLFFLSFLPPPPFFPLSL